MQEALCLVRNLFSIIIARVRKFLGRKRGMDHLSAGRGMTLME